MSRKHRNQPQPPTPYVATSERAIDAMPADPGALIAAAPAALPSAPLAVEPAAAAKLSDAGQSEIMRNQATGQFRWVECDDCVRRKRAGTHVQGACSSCDGGWVRRRTIAEK